MSRSKQSTTPYDKISHPLGIRPITDVARTVVGVRPAQWLPIENLLRQYFSASSYKLSAYIRESKGDLIICVDDPKNSSGLTTILEINKNFTEINFYGFDSQNRKKQQNGEEWLRRTYQMLNFGIQKGLTRKGKIPQGRSAGLIKYKFDDKLTAETMKEIMNIAYSARL